MTGKIFHDSFFRIAVLFLFILLGSILHENAWATSKLACKIEQGGDIFNLMFEPVTDPYNARSNNIGENFRFKAVIIGDEHKVEYIKLYVYYLRKQQAVLLHEGVYQMPVAQKNPAYADLTGVNLVYSPMLERELKYGCALLEVSP